ncbi:MAG: ATP-binding cassette domain-containing protein, partial [Clostridia bacterium]|nr:ATP-binding cassette domain-containing protein [Clostridia bacterium]
PLPKKHLFAREKKYLRANDGIDLEIHKGEIFGLVGESGSGKSTFGRVLLNLYPATSGEVIYYGDFERECIPAPVVTENGGVNLTKLSPKEMRPFRKDLQIIFQDPYSSLNPRMTVGQLIEEGVATHHFFKKGSKEMGDYVRKMMGACGLREDMMYRYPHQFSGGQRQRISIARALAVKPKFVVCDECVSALDVSIQSQILNLLSDLKTKEGLTYLFISHDLSVVRYLSDRIGVMYLGKIVELAEADVIFNNPRHPYTIALLSAIPNMEEKKEEAILLSGNLPSPISPPKGCPFHTRCFMAEKICQRNPAPLVEIENGHFVACHFAHQSTEEKCRLARLKRE